MVKIIVPEVGEEHLDEAVAAYMDARRPVALTGAGISVESGIPDFRSPGGLWTVMPADEYASIDVFLHNPEKAWKLYRAIADSLKEAMPNRAHLALAELEKAGKLAGVVTQNVDGLHHAAGSTRVIEMHGDHRRLQCLTCRTLVDAVDAHFESDRIPRCGSCDDPLKPNVVLFGEDVRGMDEIANLLRECDLLLVIGTSAKVYPAAGLPASVKRNNGTLFEFNLGPTSLTHGATADNFFSLLSGSKNNYGTDYFFEGTASETLTLLRDRLTD